MSTIDVTSAATPSDEQSSLSRRNLLRLSVAGAGATVAGPVLARTGLLGHADGTVQQGTVPNGVVSGSAPMTGPKVPKFQRELVVPPVIAPTETRTEKVLGKDATVHYYDVTQEKGYADLLPTPFPKTEIWGYNGIYPGPTFRQTQNGAYTVVRNTNTLPQSTSTHLHSSPTQPSHDGHPDDQTWAEGDKTQPAKSAFDGGQVYCPQHVYRYPNAQETRTLWYHDHGMHHTATNVYKGLLGFFIQDPDQEAIDKFDLHKLPSGHHDVPLVVADMQFDVNGKPAYNDNGHDSLWGNVILVNGRAWPKMTVDRTKYRFRVLVADLSRGYNFQLSAGDKGSPAPAATIIATEAGLLTTPAPVTSWRQGMAERYEVIVDFSKLKSGEKVTLKNLAADGDMGQVMQFVANDAPANPGYDIPARLNDYVFGGQEKDVTKPARHFVFERKNGEWVINGLAWDGRVAASPKVGDTERWVFQNKSGGWFHPVHVHLVDFHIVRRNGKAPFSYEKGWKDVVFVGPNETVELVMKFHKADQVDPSKPATGKYVIHCHNLIHEDNDMMTQFETTETTTSAGNVAALGATSHTMSAQQVKDMRTKGHSMMVQFNVREA